MSDSQENFKQKSEIDPYFSSQQILKRLQSIFPQNNYMSLDTRIENTCSEKSINTITEKESMQQNKVNSDIIIEKTLSEYELLTKNCCKHEYIPNGIDPTGYKTSICKKCNFVLIEVE